LLYRLNLTAAAGLLRPLNREQRAALLAALPADLTARLTRLVGAAYYVITDPSIYALCYLVCGQVAARLEKHATMRAMFGDG